MQNYFTAYASILDDFSLSKQGYKLALLLLKSANAEGKSFKSKSTMAIECKCSLSTISRAISELKRLKIIATQSQTDRNRGKKTRGCNRQTSNNYYILLKKENSGIKYHVADECLSLSPSELKLYSYIAKRIGNRGSWAISRSEMVKALGFSSSTVFYGIKALERKQLIVIENNKENGYHESNKYSLVFTQREENEVSKAILHYDELSQNGKKLFEFIKNKNGYLTLSNKKMSAQVKLSLPQLKQATRELEHYQMITARYNISYSTKEEYEIKLSEFLDTPEDDRIVNYRLECLFDERSDVVPVLPKDVANGEPALVNISDTAFKLTSLAPVQFKIYCYLLWRNLQAAEPQNNELLLQQCNITLKNYYTALIAFAYPNMIEFTNDNRPVAAHSLLYPDFSSSEPFTLSNSNFKVYAYLWLISGKKHKVYVEKSTITNDCAISRSTVSLAIKQLKEMNLIHTEPLYSQIYGRLGNIYTLVGKNDMGG